MFQTEAAKLSLAAGLPGGVPFFQLFVGPHLHLPFRGGVVAVFACAHKLSIGTANQPTNSFKLNQPKQDADALFSHGNPLCIRGSVRIYVFPRRASDSGVSRPEGSFHTVLRFLVGDVWVFQPAIRFLVCLVVCSWFGVLLTNKLFTFRQPSIRLVLSDAYLG